MLRSEFVPVMAFISAAVGKPVSEETVRVYFDLLGDLPLLALHLAAKRAVLESQYPTLPPVGTLRRLAVEAMQPSRLPPDEAWELTRKAILRFGYYREEAGLVSLPDEVRRAAECLGWQSLCDSTQPEVCRAQFRKAYESLSERKQRMDLLPQSMRKTIAQLSQGFALPALTDSREAS